MTFRHWRGSFASHDEILKLTLTEAKWRPQIVCLQRPAPDVERRAVLIHRRIHCLSGENTFRIDCDLQQCAAADHNAVAPRFPTQDWCFVGACFSSPLKALDFHGSLAFQVSIPPPVGAGHRPNSMTKGLSLIGVSKPLAIAVLAVGGEVAGRHQVRKGGEPEPVRHVRAAGHRAGMLQVLEHPAVYRERMPVSRNAVGPVLFLG